MTGAVPQEGPLAEAPLVLALAPLLAGALLGEPLGAPLELVAAVLLAPGAEVAAEEPAALPPLVVVPEAADPLPGPLHAAVATSAAAASAPARSRTAAGESVTLELT